MLTAQTRSVTGRASSRWSYLAFVPVVAIGILWGWLVPYGFVAMWMAHDTQVDEIGQVDGFDVVERHVGLFPVDRGGELRLRSVDGSVSELVDDLVVLGYQAEGDNPAELSRSRSDRFEADVVSIAGTDDELLAVEVAVAERGLTETWWMITIVCFAAIGVLIALALGARWPGRWPDRPST